MWFYSPSTLIMKTTFKWCSYKTVFTDKNLPYTRKERGFLKGSKKLQQLHAEQSIGTTYCPVGGITDKLNIKLGEKLIR